MVNYIKIRINGYLKNINDNNKTIINTFGIKQKKIISFMNDNLRADMIKKVVEAGVYPYTEYDYYEYRQVANFLNKYHNFYKH